MTRDEWLDLPREVREAIRKVESKARARGASYGCRVFGPDNPRVYLRMLAIYRDAYIMNLSSRIRYEVDHVKPLAKGGRHHPDNMAIIPMVENRRKGAKH